MMSEKYLLVIGYGYLGECFVEHYGKEFSGVYVTSRSSDKIAVLADVDITGICLDINDDNSWSSLSELKDKPLAVCCFATPSQIDIEQFTSFVSELNNYSIEKALLSSSTVVYGQQEIEVDSDSEVSIDSERAHKQYQLEQNWCGHLRNTCLVRLAGLYGPGRVIGKRQLVAGNVLPGREDDWLNLIHVQDAAALIKKMLDSDMTGPELGCDDNPVQRRQYYSELAAHLQLDKPVFANDDCGSRRGRRCNNALTKTRLDWQPEYRSYLDFFAELATQ